MLTFIRQRWLTLTALSTDAYNFIDDISSTSKTSKDYLATLKIEYDREGNIRLPLTAPIFSAMGMEIVNTSSGESVVSNHILKPGNFVLDIESIVEQVKEILKANIYNNPTAQFSNVTLEENGIYKILLTNGNNYGSNTVSKVVHDENLQYFQSLVLSYVFTRGLKKFLPNPSCMEAIDLAIAEIGIKFVEWSERPPSKQEIWDLVKEVKIKSLEPLAKCGLPSGLKYLEFISLWITKHLTPLDEVHNTSLMAFFARDYFLSNIEIEEKRNFQDGISYGELTYYDLTDKQISGETESVFTYEGLVEETEVSYGIDRPLTGSTFSTEETQIKAEGLPFQATLLSGDAILNGSNPIISDENGKVILEGQFGEQDSEIEISPINGHTSIEPITINLISESEPLNLTEGQWKGCNTAITQTSGPCTWGDDRECSLDWLWRFTPDGTVYTLNGEDLEFEWRKSYYDESEISEQLLEGGIATRNQIFIYRFQGKLISPYKFDGVLTIINNVDSNWEPYDYECFAIYNYTLSK